MGSNLEEEKKKMSYEANWSSYLSGWLVANDAVQQVYIAAESNEIKEKFQANNNKIFDLTYAPLTASQKPIKMPAHLFKSHQLLMYLNCLEYNKIVFYSVEQRDFNETARYRFTTV